MRLRRIGQCGAMFLAVVETNVAVEDTRPNLIVIMTDDQRWDSLSLTGNEVVRTPHIDRLAAEGFFFAQATISSPICTPSRASFFLGQYERRHGINFNSGTALSEEAWRRAYPVRLREAGYFTGYVGKNHVPVGAQGYASGIMERTFDYWYAAHNHLGFYPKARRPIFREAKADTQIEILAEGVAGFVDPEAGFTQGALSFLDRRPEGRPFCLTVSFNVPHNAGTGSMRLQPSDPELYRTAYRDRLDAVPLPPTYQARADLDEPRLPPGLLQAQYRQKSYAYVDTPADLRERKVREYQTIAGIDRFMGELRERLDELGLAKNTVLIFVSDHGIMHGEFGLGGKGLNYEPCLRIPFIVYDPAAPASARGRRSDALAQAVDLAPTLFDYAGVPASEHVQGVSLRPLAEGREFVPREYAFAENLWSTAAGNPRCESVRTAHWKYIRYFANDRDEILAAFGSSPVGRGSEAARGLYERWLDSGTRGEQPVYEELFDLKDDPHEAKNLVNVPGFERRLEEFRNACRDLVAFAGAGRSRDDVVPLAVRSEPEE